jgi:hypothetical protein
VLRSLCSVTWLDGIAHVTRAGANGVIPAAVSVPGMSAARESVGVSADWRAGSLGTVALDPKLP